jgi:hypothetical protein
VLLTFDDIKHPSHRRVKKAITPLTLHEQNPMLSPSQVINIICPKVEEVAQIFSSQLEEYACVPFPAKLEHLPVVKIGLALACFPLFSFARD